MIKCIFTIVICVSPLLGFSMELQSNSFSHLKRIPIGFTCQGKDTSPHLSWKTSGKPRSFVLIVDDPDAPDPKAPKMTWVHWVVYNIPGDVRELSEGIGSHNNPLMIGKHGLNDWKKKEYGGPCPPIGKHRYFFKLYGLDKILDIKNKITKKDLLSVIESHVIDSATIIGTYSKN
jgi:Raf kinase inhibitor-like YbhB/YbcL family protein